MKIGVTGGNGFIGSYIIDEIKARGHEALVLDHKAREGNVLLGDVRDATIVQELAAHVDGIIHMAAVLGTAETIDNPGPAAETNILGTVNVFESCARYDLPVVFAAVGNSNIGRGTYCVTKTTGEQFVSMYREDRGVRITAVRPMNAYGPRQSAPTPYGASKVRKIVPSFVCSALSGDPMKLYGGGTQISDSVFVADVARVFVQALEKASEDVIPDHPIDVGNAIPTTVLAVAEEVQANVPGAVIEAVPMRLGEPHGGPVSTEEDLNALVAAVLSVNPGIRPIDARRVLRQLGTVVSADVTTLAAIGLSHEDFLPLSEGIRRTVDWFRENEGITWRSPN